MPDTPIDAFAWLIEQFRSYTCNQMSWLQVRTVLREAEEMRDQFQGQQHETSRRD